VFSEGNGRVTEFDTRSARRIEKPIVAPLPPAECCGLYSGPVLAADASGAWLVKGGYVGKPQLVHLPVGRHPPHSYPLPITPTGVATGAGAVWVVGMGPHDDELLRIDPADGRVTARRRFAASAGVDSIAFGYGWVWLVSSERATLYRVDPHFRRPLRSVRVSDSRATRPELINGEVWVRVEGNKGETYQMDPSSLTQLHWELTGPPTSQENLWAKGRLWWYDSPSGTVFWEAQRLATHNGQDRRIRVTRYAPTQGGPCLSSITTADESVWVTAAPLLHEASSFICQR
jgi:hypothetical protein